LSQISIHHLTFNRIESREDHSVSDGGIRSRASFIPGWKKGREYGTNGNNGTNGKILVQRFFRLFRYFRLFPILSSSVDNRKIRCGQGIEEGCLMTSM
jgi:hypothetical protein